jgi:SAM-dependent methyltransferase
MNQPTPQEQIARMLGGFQISQAIYVAAKLGIADLLAGGPRAIDELAQATGTHARSLYRLLRALASLGVFAEEGDRTFTLTPLADCLRRDIPGSQHAFALMTGEEQFRAWCDMIESVRTGRSAFEIVFGQPIFDYLSERPEKARVFDAAMTSIHGRETGAIADAYDFSHIGELADIGGGNGSTLIGILERHPALRGLLFDLPGVAAHAEAAVRAAGLSDRCRVVGGSFFESIPEGADTYMLRHIIHDWDDEKSAAILRNIRRVARPDTRLLVVENVIAPGNAPSLGKLLDLVMLVVPGGLERTEEEYRELFAASGFRLTRVVPTAAEVCVIEGEPV